MSKNSNSVTFKIDSRLFYTLIAVVAVLGIFAIGMWLGQQIGQPNTPTTASTGQTVTDNAAAAAPEVQNLTDPSVVQVATAPAEAARGAAPVSVEKQPVGASEPRLAVLEVNDENNYTFHLGTIPADIKTEREFTLTNLGTSTLVIENTSASCGCTAAVADLKELAPGQSTALHVGYDPRVNQEFGKFVQKQVRIKSNDPVVPLAEFTITADVEAQ